MDFKASQSIWEDIPRPVLTEPGALVENIYPITGTEDTPDLESQDTMGFFLVDRLRPDESLSRTHFALTPTGRTMPGLARLPSDFKEVTRWRRTLEWLVSPKEAVGIMLGSLALFNILGNIPSIEGAAEYVGHEIYRTFVPLGKHRVVEEQKKEVPQSTKHIGMLASSGDQVGSVYVDPVVTNKFVASVQRAESIGGKIISVQVTGNTSNEWGGDSSLGAINPENTQLGMERAEAALKAINEDGLKLPTDSIQLKQDQHIITPAEKTELLNESQAAGFSSITAAVEAADNNQPLPKRLLTQIKRLFTSNKIRGVSIDATIEYPGHDHLVIKKVGKLVPDKDKVPRVPDPNFFWFIPMLPIRKRERYTKVKQTHRWSLIRSQQIYRPEIIREEVDQAWLRIRPEAVEADGNLVEDAWAYTRKIEYMLRDERIRDVLRADFKNSKGEEKSLRILFVDESPAKETVAAFEELLGKFASMNDGVLSDRVRAIIVYPSECSGTEHGDPKLIALGFDKQSADECLGTYTYPLKVVEMHMPTSLDSEEIAALLKAFNGPTWVMSHEVAGHASDRNDLPQRLRRVLVRGIPNAHVIDGDPRTHKMQLLSKVLRKLPVRNEESNDPIYYDIEYQVQDNEGKNVTISTIVDQYDPRLSHALKTTIVGYHPTQYAATNDSEHFAETAATLTTGIEVPYHEAGTKVELLRSDSGERTSFATGYRPDPRAQKIVTESIGAENGSFPISFSTIPALRVSTIRPNEDPVLAREMKRSRGRRILQPEEMVAILARTVRRRK